MNATGAQIFDFSDTPPFPDPLLHRNNPDAAASGSNCHPYHHGGATLNDEIKQPLIFNDDPIDDITAAIDFTPTPPFPAAQTDLFLDTITTAAANREPFAIPSGQFCLENMMGGPLPPFCNQFPTERWPALATPTFEEEFLPPVRPFIRLKTPQQLMTPYFPAATMSVPPPFSSDAGDFYHGGGLIQGPDLSHQQLEFNGDNAGLIFDLQGQQQNLEHGGESPNPLASEISSLEDTYKVRKLSAEERNRKIHRYMEKRNLRNYTKKIKYACRKTLADSRPRVRGRFAKNDEQGEQP